MLQTFGSIINIIYLAVPTYRAKCIISTVIEIARTSQSEYILAIERTDFQSNQEAWDLKQEKQTSELMNK